MTTHHRISAVMATALALSMGLGQASARLMKEAANGSLVPATPTAAAAPPSNHVSQATGHPTIVRATAHNGGFDWRDAGIGATGGLALSMLGLGGGLLVMERRRSQAASR